MTMTATMQGVQDEVETIQRQASGIKTLEDAIDTAIDGTIQNPELEEKLIHLLGYIHQSADTILTAAEKIEKTALALKNGERA